MHQIGQNVLFSNIDGVLSIKGHSIISIFPVITFLSFAWGRPHAADANTRAGSSRVLSHNAHVVQPRRILRIGELKPDINNNKTSNGKLFI